MQICNLVQEFNGLVSKRVGRKISPFYFKIDPVFFLLFLLFNQHPFKKDFSELCACGCDRKPENVTRIINGVKKSMLIGGYQEFVSRPACTIINFSA